MSPSRFALRTVFVIALAAVFSGPARAMAFDDPPADTAKMARDMRGAYEAGNYKKALEIGEKLHSLEPDDPTHMYNLGCLNCLLGNKAKAYDWLEKAIEAGYKDADQMAADGDFKTIRGEDRFRGLLRKIRGEETAEKHAVKKKPVKDDDEGDGDDDEKPAPSKKKGNKAEAKKSHGDEDEEDDSKDKEDVNEKVQELTRDLIKAAEDKEYDKALHLALKAQKLADVSLTNYNVACMYSLLNMKEQSLDALEKAVKQGNFPQDIVAQMEGDTDLDNVKKEPRYKKIFAMAKEGQHKEGPRGRNEGEKVKSESKLIMPKGKEDEEGLPLVVVLHGFGGNMNDSAKTWKKAASKAGAALLVLQGPFKMDDGRFQWGHDIDTVEELVMNAIDKAVAEKKVDKKHIVIAGFSQGGQYAWALALRNADTFHGAIPVCGKAETRDSSYQDADIAKLHVYSMTGADDDKAMNKSNQDAVKKLEKKGAKVKISEYEGVGHAYPDEADAELAKAIKFAIAD